MKILLLVQREAGTNDTSWVIDACDEFTLDEWNGALPTPMQEKIDADPGNVRTLWVTIPDGSLERVWSTPKVEGQVAA